MNSSFGGNIADYPGPLKFRWPDDLKHLRELNVTIQSWKGTELNAKHYYVSIDQDDNPFWDEEEQAWRVCWDHPKQHKGTVIHERFNTLHEAILWVDRTIADLFSDTVHYIHFTDYTEDNIKAKWNALKLDGD